MLGVLTGGFERFFQHMGTATDHPTKDQPPFIPDFPRMKAAAQQHNMQFMPDFQWPDAASRRLTARIHRRSPPARHLGGPCPRRPAAAAAGSHAPLPAAATPAASGCSPACRTPRSRGSGRWSWTSWLPPAGDGPVPVVVFLHGGGWRLGSRHVGRARRSPRCRPSPFEQVARAGIAVASIDYRLSGEAIWPAQLHDAKAAVRWLRARAGELGIDPDRIAAWGESAGGHLAELLGLTGDDPALEGEVGIAGPSSAVSRRRRLVRAERRRRGRHRQRRGPGGPDDPRGAAARRRAADACPTLAAQASPISHVVAGRAAVPAAARPGRPARSRACRASGCTTALTDGRRRRRAAALRRRRPHVAGRAGGRGRRRAPHDRLPARDQLGHVERQGRQHMRIVGIRRPGSATVEVAALSEDGDAGRRSSPGSTEFWADAAGLPRREPAGATAAVARRRVRAAGAARTPG